jgi:nitrite reductase/ring-hydroxylating ferredoxin subunit
MWDGAAVTGRGLRRYLDDLAAGRRPRPFRATPDEADELRVALELHAARPGAGTPREGFVAELHQRLADELSTPQDTSGARDPVPLARTSRRRLLVQGAGLAAASAAVGATVDHLVTRPAEPGPQELAPTTGTWQTVAASTEVPEGAVRAFDLGPVNGFVHRADGVVRAVSGSCTHQGCRLRLDAGGLACPCHTTVFSPDGDLVTHQLPVAPRPLRHFAAREVDGVVQVFAPPAAV